MTETITMPKEDFRKLISDVEIVINDVESILSSEDKLTKKRIDDIESGKVKGKTEKELDEYLKNRGIKVG
mgnify:CR=1 FL=1